MIPPYRKTNPLAAALGPSESPTTGTFGDRPNLPAPRLIDLRSYELSPDCRVGDSILMRGFVQSMDADGSVRVAFVRVEDEQQKEQKFYVTPPESPAP